MKTIFPKNTYHIPKYFIINLAQKKLGRISTEITKLIRGKENSFYTPGINLGNFIIAINTYYIQITGKKILKKKYYFSTNRPGNLHYETFNQLKNRLPIRIIQKAVFGMLPKTTLGRQYFKRFYIYIKNPFKNISYDYNL
jgi:large subunit ribosomal protein L13